MLWMLFVCSFMLRSCICVGVCGTNEGTMRVLGWKGGLFNKGSSVDAGCLFGK